MKGELIANIYFWLSGFVGGLTFCLIILNRWIEKFGKKETLENVIKCEYRRQKVILN